MSAEKRFKALFSSHPINPVNTKKNITSNVSTQAYPNLLGKKGYVVVVVVVECFDTCMKY